MVIAKEVDGEYHDSILQAAVFCPAVPASSLTINPVSTSTAPIADGSGGGTLSSSVPGAFGPSGMIGSGSGDKFSVVPTTGLLQTIGNDNHYQNLVIRQPQLFDKNTDRDVFN